MGDVAPFVLALATLTSAVGGIALLVSKMNRLSVGQDQVHVMVNSRLTEALAKIDALERRIVQLTGSKP